MELTKDAQRDVVIVILIAMLIVAIAGGMVFLTQQIKASQVETEHEQQVHKIYRYEMSDDVVCFVFDAYSLQGNDNAISCVKVR